MVLLGIIWFEKKAAELGKVINKNIFAKQILENNEVMRRILKTKEKEGTMNIDESLRDWIF